MHRFTLRKGQLWCEAVPVARIAQAVGTPLYLYSQGTLLDHYRKLKSAFAPLRPLLCFSVKANGNLAVLRTLVRAGAGLDVVSGGELYKALKAGCPPGRIVYASVGKSPEEIRQALRARIFCFNVESVPELQAIQAQAKRLKLRAPVALRVNPDVAAATHPYITTGTSENKFGIALKEAETLIRQGWDRFPDTTLLGFHLHIGSQITQPAPFVESIRRVGQLIRRLRGQGVRLPWLNLGGGLGIVYKDERPLAARAFARPLLPALRRMDVKLVLEPGRFIAGNSGILVTRVLYVKRTRTKRFAIVDAGMNDLLRPSLYGAHHEILKVVSKGSRRPARLRYDVVGPVCESADFFAKGRLLPPLEPGELLAILGAGAYGFSMASNYNARPRPPEVMVRANRWRLVRKRETYRDLIRGERFS